MLRCINIDWLEVFCFEPLDEPRTPQWYIDRGYIVHERAYGTPNYRQMFTIVDEGRAIIEVRRDPLSVKSRGGIFEEGSCHVRLTNFACYLKGPVAFLSEFLLAVGLTFRSLSRIDLCLDFQRFDSGLTPHEFVASFMAGEYQKINQCNIAAHGKDGWLARTWNSLKWGAPTSALTTKLYNKSLELKEVKDKPYIRSVWEACGLDGAENVWRLEFAIMPSSNFLLSASERTMVPRSLSAFSSKDRQYFQFAAFAHKYFHFKKREYTSSGALRPKHRCSDVDLFHFAERASYFEPTHLVWEEQPGRTEKLLARRLYEMSLDKSLDAPLRRACEDVSLHMADRYIILDYVRQLENLLDYNAKRHPNYASDMALLEHVRNKYQWDNARPKTVRKCSGYLVIE